jgi:hypothetical protein
LITEFTISKIANMIVAGNLKSLKPNDTMIVYHGTQMNNIDSLINGFDANKKMSRHYNSAPHAGLFVAPDAKTTGSFGPVVLEIVVRAKNLHGTNYDGNIGRNWEDSDDWLEKKYPDSFRPSLTLTLLQTNEPQAILRGLVSPKQIKRVNYNGKWYSRDKFIKLTEKKGVGFDLSSPRYTMDQLFKNIAKMLKAPTERVVKGFGRLNRQKRRQQLEMFNFGDTAIRKYLNQMEEYYE